MAISADDGEGLDELRDAVADLLPDSDALAEPPDPPASWSTASRRRATASPSSARTASTWCAGKRIERIAAQTNFENEESAERFQRDLARLGVDAELRQAGVRPGDTVRIGPVELEWEPPEDDR